MARSQSLLRAEATMHLAPYSVMKVDDKWAVHVCGARVLSCDRRATAIRAVACARELLDALEAGRLDGDAEAAASASRPSAASGQR
jgi:hypothetical protein